MDGQWQSSLLEFRNNVRNYQNMLLASSCSQVKLYIFRLLLTNTTNEMISSDAMHIKMKDIVSTGEHLMKGVRIIDADKIRILLGEYPTLYIIDIDIVLKSANRKTFSFSSVLTIFNPMTLIITKSESEWIFSYTGTNNIYSVNS